MTAVTADRNKSALTHKITTASYNWLDSHGFKPVETEVSVPVPAGEKQWIADLAGVICATQTELIEMRMISRFPGWNAKQDKKDKWEEQSRAMFRRMTCLVEVKASRSDYRGDRKWTMTPPVDLAYIAVPSGMVKMEEWPEGWGVLELCGDAMRKARNPVPRVATVEEQLDVIYEVALRRDHRTRHAHVREFQKRQRIEDAERVSMNRIDTVIAAVVDVANGHLGRYGPLESVEKAFEWHGVRHVSERHLEKVRPLFRIASKPPTGHVSEEPIL